jgi:transcriptional regulator GlxA family with amidase domain
MRSTIHSPSAGNGAKLARRSSKHFGWQPDALGLATRLAAGRLREAGKLGMSSRTLARRLMAEGLNFGEILNQLRSDLAQLYLRERTLSISQIAWLVGFQGVGAFSHGCRRWTGMNPKSMRAQLLASD